MFSFSPKCVLSPKNVEKMKEHSEKWEWSSWKNCFSEFPEFKDSPDSLVNMIQGDRKWMVCWLKNESGNEVCRVCGKEIKLIVGELDDFG